MSIQHHEETSIPGFGASPESTQAAVAVAEAFIQGTDPESDEAAPVAGVPIRQVPSVPAPTQEAPVETQAVEAKPFSFASFEPDLSPELAEMLEDEPPDFEAEARAEIEAELRAATDRDEYVPPVDTDGDTKTRALQKRVEFLEGRLVETSRGKWVRENLDAYPLLKQYAADEVKGITATSRRGFAREAAALNDRVMRIAKPLLDDLQAKLATRGEEITEERRAAVDRSWGKAAVDVAATGASADQVKRIQAARQSEDLGAVIREMIIE